MTMSKQSAAPYKLKTMDEVVAAMPAKQRAQVHAETKRLIQEELTLRELRKARKLTQAKLAKRMGVTQDVVSRTEVREDLMLSTLQKTVRAMGGKLELVVKFADLPEVRLTGFADVG